MNPIVNIGLHDSEFDGLWRPCGGRAPASANWLARYCGSVVTSGNSSPPRRGRRCHRFRSASAAVRA
ncbi:hypothetical protein CBM2599_P70011 [Cupriavidus taiwanensis]|nr:hypothetical protein CBM2599_P70011 [Cupriavidus taiwanensis]SOZ52596.1 hypothetical protein CBM2610_P70011 [Cupriavidus taiwanensis]